MLPGTLAPFPPGRRPALAGVAGGTGWQWRALLDDDLPWLVQLYASTREEELRSVPWPEAAKRQFLSQQFVAQHQHYLARHPRAHYLAILREEQPVGRFYVDEDGEEDLIVDISLSPSSRGTGIGTAVIGCQQQACAARGRALRLHVMQHNHGALRLYQRMGFVATSAAAGELYLPMRWEPTHRPLS
ncbi:N-acetyltransferase [Stenotrophomonas sp. JAI102]|uniref:GNAT family N-acetyltransferase n=1 Tax=Stenotrophomonas sp. JAI102 TaxID=2723077 RepID=UPI0015C768E6|nr:N-acetyltransferase [Stenotrophomonas sp. JAI102]NYF37193.1 ribosomal protein S18 acetylase RimI-like enzyme [Stenotrophomonas sp. JAI102]